MTITEAFELVSNHDCKEAHRRFAPQHGLLQFDRDGIVRNVDRFKIAPDDIQQHEALSRYPGCLQIFTMPHWFATAEDLQKRINSDLWLFTHMKRQPTDK